MMMLIRRGADVNAAGINGMGDDVIAPENSRSSAPPHHTRPRKPCDIGRRPIQHRPDHQTPKHRELA